ncbi:putative type IV pilus assembly protein PilM [Fibrobacter succinogenes subsp. succinogenes S85]|uniref:Putative type IV pilus assembly protein PilM n=1 Tax=Fibrobacter succinogenes (strain ATCC 19169 / S85) TaxID=59374 RepID=C9RKD6_FIBSS|nr:pilus assembly protein PilM [Fibrobacter succinogenes]ACX73864.1 Tfp pilus assembly protein ATPase PilM-like protein [Fibrobacter succinogenes subsp. succinogenes S85]ADL24853.1 putative type IV pilus assembly protein PilM [Fibrobacter succinogenes subsp. succinogenes S85]
MALGLIARIRGERETVGIDVGHYSIKYVKVYHDANGKRIVREVDLEPVPAGSIINGLIQRRDTDDLSTEKGAKKEKDGFDKLGEAFSKLLLRHPIDENVDVVASVNCGAGEGGVLVDRLSIKVPKNGNEAAIIVQTAQSRPPFDDQDNVLDYEVVSREGDEVKVNVVAAKSSMLDSWAQFFTRKGVRLSALDVDIFGLLNSFVMTASDEERKKTTAIFNIGDNKMSVGFIQDGAFHSVRSMNGGSLNVIINKLSSSLDISAEKCHEMFEKNDLKVIDNVAISVLEDAMKVAFEELMSQITFGIRYHSSAEDSRPLERILIGGGGAAVPGLLEYIAEKTGIETATVNPFRSVECDSSVVDKDGMSIALSNIYAPALGLAMRKF